MESNSKNFEKIANVFKDILWPVILTLYSIFAFFYSINLNSLDEISKLEFLPDPVVQFLLNYRALIMLSFMCVALACLVVYFINRHRRSVQMEKKADLDFMNFMTHFSRQWDCLIKDTVSDVHNTDALKYYADIEGQTSIMLDDISNFLTSRCHDRKIKTCIKMLEPHSLWKMLETGKLEDCKVFTLVRGGDLKNYRREMEIDRLKEEYYTERLTSPFRPESIGLISDFYTMMQANQSLASSDSPAAQAFACSNLLCYRNRIDQFNTYAVKSSDGAFEVYRPHRTTSGKWWDNYNSAVFVPIRVLYGDLPDEWKQQVNCGHWTGKYLVIGFLCVDHVSDLPKRMTNDLTDYCKEFANIFCNYLFNVADVGLKVLWNNPQPKSKTANEIPQEKQAVGKVPNFLMRLCSSSKKIARRFQRFCLVRYTNVAPARIDENDLFYKFVTKEN